MFIKLLIIILGITTNCVNRTDVHNRHDSVSVSVESVYDNQIADSIIQDKAIGTIQDFSSTKVQKDEIKSIQWLSKWITAIIAIIVSFFIPYAVYLVQQMARKSQEFQSYAKSLYSDNPIEQASAAILLRSFLKKQKIGILIVSIDYTREAKNILTSLLKTSIPTSLQKNLADGFSYANNLDGQDMQFINMNGALIKPPSRILYEKTKKIKYKNDRLSMRNADFFHAVVQECSINNVDASNAIFMYSILCGSSFKNCILTDARFNDANISRVIFDEDCELERACFKNAIGIKDAKVKRRKEEIVVLLDLIKFLDKDGIFYENVKDQYEPISNQHLKVFVSKLGIMNSYQQFRYGNIINRLTEKGIEIDTIERQSYMNTSQLTDVVTHLDKCDGCIVFAFEYLDVGKGIIHKDVESNDNQIVDNTAFSSPWLQIEAALANGKRMPCLIVCGDNLRRDGMFDEAIVKPDKNMFVLQYSDDIHSWEPTLTKWIGMITEYHRNYLKY